MRNLGHIPSQPEHAEDHHEDRSGQTDLGGAADSLSAHGRRDERHGGAGRPADQDGIATQKRRDRCRHDRGEQAELGRQAHQPGEGQAVRERDQGGDEAARGVARQSTPAVVASSWRVSLGTPHCRLAARRGSQAEQSRHS